MNRGDDVGVSREQLWGWQFTNSTGGKRIERSEISRDVSRGGLKSLDGGIPVLTSYHLFLTDGRSVSIGTSGLTVVI